MRLRNWLLTGTSLGFLALTPIGIAEAQDADLMAAYQAYVDAQTAGDAAATEAALGTLTELCIVAGYASVAGVVSPVLFRLTTAGTLDPSFGDAGVAVRPVLANVGEAYSVALAGNRFVTTGYGKDTAEARVDLIANGFTLDGALDRSFGTNGTTRVDVAGEDDRGRNLVALPDGRAILVGSGKPTGSNLDAMVVTLAANGAQTGRKLYDVGGPNDAFFGVALSPDGKRVAVVGYLGRETNGSEKDDGAVLWLQP